MRNSEQENDIPKSIPMTWPLTFSSVEFHRRIEGIAEALDKAGARETDERVRGI